MLSLVSPTLSNSIQIDSSWQGQASRRRKWRCMMLLGLKIIGERHWTVEARQNWRDPTLVVFESRRTMDCSLWSQVEARSLLGMNQTTEDLKRNWILLQRCSNSQVKSVLTNQCTKETKRSPKIKSSLMSRQNWTKISNKTSKQVKELPSSMWRVRVLVTDSLMIPLRSSRMWTKTWPKLSQHKGTLQLH